MLVLRGRNVCELWHSAIDLMSKVGVREESRAGPVLVAPYPVTSVYERPTERVLRDPVRDANPFFHLFESLWMLAGRNDAAFLSRFVRDFGERFAETDGTVHGAYGYRWRHSMGVDQLDEVVRKLREDPTSRQCVIQMWDAKSFQERGLEDGWDLIGTWRDRPCNTHVYLRVRETADRHLGVVRGVEFRERDQVLDLTVCCRSNDVVWGAYGANAVHFSVLHEYLAGRIGVGVGTMYQVSNNWHAYVDVWKKKINPDYIRRSWDPYDERITQPQKPVRPRPMGTNWDRWDDDLRGFMEWTESPEELSYDYENRWFHEVAQPMYLAHLRYREKDFDMARLALQRVQAGDWRDAAIEWIERRQR